MIKVIERMPVGTIGLEASGKVTEEDYRDVLVPIVAKAQGQGKVRLLYVLSKDFESYSAGAMWADTKLWARHLDGWERIAIITDSDWMEHAVKAVNWMASGELKVFESDDLRDAKIWLVGIDD